MIKVPISSQPDETTCGPTCLHSIYRYYNDQVDLDSVIREVLQLEEGGTFGSWLAVDALKRGYKARIYTYNLQVFDPSWFELNRNELRQRLKAQMAVKNDPKLHAATEGYLTFLDLGGEIRMEDLRSGILRDYLKKGHPIIAGLSATFLYRSMREFGPNQDYDDIRGEPAGHFVVLYGYDRETKLVSVADPLMTNPLGKDQFYDISINRVVNAILLGIVTYDAHLIIITPGSQNGASS